MSFSVTKTSEALAQNVEVTEEALVVELHDGRTVSVPLPWFPRLLNGSEKERLNWRLIGQGEGIHWPDLDEDVATEDLLAGRGSSESQSSLRKWLESRRKVG